MRTAPPEENAAGITTPTSVPHGDDVSPTNNMELRRRLDMLEYEFVVAREELARQLFWIADGLRYAYEEGSREAAHNEVWDARERMRALLEDWDIKKCYDEAA
jgi:hypothetical protein